MFQLSRKAAEFFEDLAENHSLYPDNPSEVVDNFVTEWEMREHLPNMYRTFYNEE